MQTVLGVSNVGRDWVNVMERMWYASGCSNEAGGYKVGVCTKRKFFQWAVMNFPYFKVRKIRRKRRILIPPMDQGGKYPVFSWII